MERGSAHLGHLSEWAGLSGRLGRTPADLTRTLDQAELLVADTETACR